MIKSMTGYGRGAAEAGAWRAAVSVKTVNHRYADISVRMQRRYQFAEERVKKALRAYVSRGKIEVQVDIESGDEAVVRVRPDVAVAKGYYRAMRELEKELDTAGNITLEFLAAQPDVLVTSSADIDEDTVAWVCEEAVRKAGAELNAMRETEGGKLAEDIVMRAGIIGERLKIIEERAPELSAVYAEKLRARIADLSSIEPDSELFTARIALETAAMADKCNITEETVRLRSHIDQLVALAEGRGGKDTGPAGKKLDFLMQEMNREANTIGSKANDLKITAEMLEIKSEVEKIREQVQNIE
ncbi:MAG: YicC family protein [Clostridiales Family XIII bacterium]|jgi:uncharacterized protein (TIGR00255 family)|nr:YicC family protein [Clostridiales Family XIII bacterium]